MMNVRKMMVHYVDIDCIGDVQDIVPMQTMQKNVCNVDEIDVDDGGDVQDVRNVLYIGEK